MNPRKLFDSLTNSSKVLFSVGMLSLLLDILGKGTIEMRLMTGVGMLVWLVIMVYQNQCLGPRDCSTYSWILVALITISLLVKIYHVNMMGMNKNQFVKMLNPDQNNAQAGYDYPVPEHFADEESNEGSNEEAGYDEEDFVEGFVGSMTST